MLRHGHHINVGGISMSVLYYDLIHASSQGGIADSHNLIGHLLCVLLVSRFFFVRFIIEGCSGTAFNIRTDKQFHCSCLSFYKNFN